MDWSIKTVYVMCAAVGGLVLIVQTLLSFLGAGDHDMPHDVGHLDVGASGSGEDPGHDAGLGLISIRGVSGFLCMFGLVGWYGISKDWPPFAGLGAAAASGTAILFLVAWMLSMQRKLSSAGNLDPKNAIGRSARVYLRVPGQSSGRGKVTVSIQGRTHEYNALTKGTEIATGNEVRIVRLVTEDTFEVEPLS